MLNEILEQLSLYVSAQTSRDELEDWVLQRTWFLKQEDDPQAFAVAGRILLAMAEYTSHHLDDEELHERLKNVPAELGISTPSNSPAGR